MGRHRIKALILDKKGRVLSVGTNSYIKTHPLQARHARKTNEPCKIFLHAEIHAIVKCRCLEQAHKMLILRYDRARKPRLAKPCMICQSAIREAGIEHVEYTM